MIILTIINTVLIIYILFHKDFSIQEETIFGGTVVGYSFFYKGRRYLYAPIRNGEKTEVRENVLFMLNNPRGKEQKLSAMFSWLETDEEIEIFRKNYEVVGRRFVNNLIKEKRNNG